MVWMVLDVVVVACVVIVCFVCGFDYLVCCLCWVAVDCSYACGVLYCLWYLICCLGVLLGVI